MGNRPRLEIAEGDGRWRRGHGVRKRLSPRDFGCFFLNISSMMRPRDQGSSRGHVDEAEDERRKARAPSQKRGRAPGRARREGIAPSDDPIEIAWLTLNQREFVVRVQRRAWTVSRSFSGSRRTRARRAPKDSRGVDDGGVLPLQDIFSQAFLDTATFVSRTPAVAGSE